MSEFADFISPMTIQGLKGRKLIMSSSDPQKKDNQILMLYVLHASIERMQCIIENIADEGTVTVPDIPGFGGMQSLYSIGITPTADALAESIYLFIKEHYGDKKFKAVGMSYGFVILTRLLQNHPDLKNQMTLIVSLAGLTDQDEFIVSKFKYLSWVGILKTFNGKYRSWVFKNVFLQPFILKTIYRVQAANHPKFMDADKVELNKRLDYEVYLWHANEPRTYILATLDVLQLKTPQIKVTVPLLHVAIDSDQYVDHDLVLNNLKKIYGNVTETKAHMSNHAPTVISSKKDAAPFIPLKARQMLSA